MSENPQPEKGRDEIQPPPPRRATVPKEGQSQSRSVMTSRTRWSTNGKTNHSRQ